MRRTGLATSQQEGRDSLGYEINREFEDMIREKLGVGEESLFDADEMQLEFVRRGAGRGA